MKIKKLKKLATKIIALTAILSVTLGGGINASAATLNIATTTTKKINVLDETYNNEDCSNIGGLSVTSSDSNKRMYVLKASNEQNEAVLYFYSNYSAINNTNYGKFEIKNLIGHANGMTIDDNYIYITCWNSASNSAAKDDIVRISRNKIWNMYKNTSKIYKGKITKNTDGVTVFSAVDQNGNVWDKRIYGITKYKANGQFIVNLGLTNNTSGTDVLTFTTASISNGKFIISNIPASRFKVNTGLSGTTGQDFEYSPNCGFFIPRWYENSKANNTIIWIKLNSLSGDDRTYTKNNSSYRHIIVNKASEGYSKYEVESLSFDCNNNLYASVNCYPYNKSKDCVVTIQRATAVSGSYKFLGSNIGK